VAFSVSLFNIKGGVGKTTITANLGHALANNGKRVLLIDADYQQNLTDIFLNQLPTTNTLYHLLDRDDLFASQCIVSTKIEGVDLIPSHKRLATIDPSASLFLLRKKMDKLVRDAYDYILFDLRPEYSIVTGMCLLASTGYIIPVKPDRHSIRGIQSLDLYIKSIQKQTELTELGILVNSYDGRTTVSKRMTEGVQKYFAKRMLETIIPINTKIDFASCHQQTVIQFDALATGSIAFAKLAEEVIMKNNGGVGIIE